jgi:GNAT superfamily N-acetyltransferase
VTPDAAVRDARPDEAAALGDLAHRSKAVWGYDDAFLDACREELSVSPAHMDVDRVRVIEGSGSIHGFYRLSIEGDEGCVELLFVDPESMGRGYGRVLWDDMIGVARGAGLTVVILDSDPNAEAFYRVMGCMEAGQAPSGSIPGRMLPRLRFPPDRRRSPSLRP